MSVSRRDDPTFFTNQCLKADCVDVRVSDEVSNARLSDVVVLSCAAKAVYYLMLAPVG